MQLALNIFGRLISSEENSSKFKLNNYDPNDGLKIIGTGPKSNPHINMFDGVWGPNTNNALTIAQKYIGSLGQSLKLGVKWNVGTKSHQNDTESEAKTNTSILRKIINYVSGNRNKNVTGDDSFDSTNFDQLPKSINWNLEVGPAEASFQKGEINVSKGDMSSLQKLYNFLTSNGLKEKKTTGSTATNIGTEGWLHEDWIQVLQWFVRRAVLKYNAVKDSGQEAASTAKDYWQSASNLWETYRKMIATYIKSGLIKSDQVINPNLIAEFSRSSSGQNESNKNNSGVKEHNTVEEQAAYMPEDQKNQSGGVGRDGARFKKPGEPQITLPFADTINLRDQELWSDFDGSELSSPILRLADFQKVPATRMAQILFATINNPQKAQRVAIENLGYNPAQYDENSGEWLIKAKQGNRVVLVPASRFLSPKEIQAAMQKYMTAAPARKYQKFLADLSAKIGEVLREWSYDAPEDMIIHVQDYYKYWQLLLNKLEI